MQSFSKQQLYMYYCNPCVPQAQSKQITKTEDIREIEINTKELMFALLSNFILPKFLNKIITTTSNKIYIFININIITCRWKTNRNWKTAIWSAVLSNPISIWSIKCLHMKIVYSSVFASVVPMWSMLLIEKIFCESI